MTDLYPEETQNNPPLHINQKLRDEIAQHTEAFIKRTGKTDFFVPTIISKADFQKPRQDWNSAISKRAPKKREGKPKPEEDDM